MIKRMAIVCFIKHHLCHLEIDHVARKIKFMCK